MKSRSSTANWPSRGSIVLALLVVRLAMPLSVSSAATYFVDANNPNARDTYPGTESLPFKTIGKATSLVNAGDTVFVKAGVYRETVILSRSGTSTTTIGRSGPVTTTSPVTLMAYPGDEGKAIINAAEPVTDWHKCLGPDQCAGNPNWQHIYWADVAALVQSHPDTGFAVRQVFQHGKPLNRSRYPNTGWSYPTSMPDPMKTFADYTLSQPPGYFTGAVCHIKTAVWQIDQIPIASFSGSTITLSKSPRYAITTRFGYYITSIVGEINEEGEWAYGPAQKKVFLWPQGDVPEGVEFSYRQYCIRSYGGTAWNVVRGLTLRNAYTYGLWLYRSNDTTIESNTVEYTYGFGLYVQATEGACDRNQLLRNTVRFSAFRGISVDARSSYTNVEGNYVYATGTEVFGGDLMNGQTHGIYITGPYTRVYNNRIDRAAYTSIYVDGKTVSRDISYNYVTNTGLSLSDGGGIYTGGFSDVPEKDHIHHNIFIDAIGCLSMDRNSDNGSPPTINTHSGATPGIYVDERGNNRVIEDNTVINSRMAGVFFHWGPSNVVQRNTLYGNRTAQIYFSGNNQPGQMLINDIVQDNILFATSGVQKTLYLSMNYDTVQFGRSDRNYFYNPYDSWHIFVNRYSSYTGWLQGNLTLDDWRALSGYDVKSKEFSYLLYLNGITLASPTKSRIIYNTTLSPTTVDLAGNKYCDVQGNPISGAVVLQPFESKILISLGEPAPEPEEQQTE